MEKVVEELVMVLPVVPLLQLDRQMFLLGGRYGKF
jgi:hypothetical protein